MQSISASDLLKQQKKMQLELLESRRRRAAAEWRGAEAGKRDCREWLPLSLLKAWGEFN